MRMWPRSLKWRTILLTLLGLVAIGVTAGYMWWRPIWEHLKWQREMATLRESPHPLTRKLARGEVRPGASIEELLEQYPPVKLWRFGRFTEAHYGNNPDLIAMDGRLVFARSGWGTSGTIVFNTMSPAEEREWSESWSEYYDRRSDGRKAAHGAVGGLMGCVEYDWRLRELANPPPYPEEAWETETADPHRAVGGVTAYMPYSTRFRDVVAAPAEGR